MQFSAPLHLSRWSACLYGQARATNLPAHVGSASCSCCERATYARCCVSLCEYYNRTSAGVAGCWDEAVVSSHLTFLLCLSEAVLREGSGSRRACTCGYIHRRVRDQMQRATLPVKQQQTRFLPLLFQKPFPRGNRLTASCNSTLTLSLVLVGSRTEV